jgi:membrane fusion protein (multidrug efflux system)
MIDAGGIARGSEAMNLVRVEFEPLAANSPVTLQHGLPGSIEVTVEQTTPAVLVLRAAGQLLAKPAQQQASSGSGSDTARP